MLGSEKVSVINRHLLTATAGITVAEALRLMTHNHSDYLFIVNQETSISSIRTLIGVFTDHDLVQLVANQINLNSITLGSVMSKELVTIKETEVQDIFAVLTKFRQHNIHHLPVIDNKGNLIGVITPQSVREIIQPLDLLRHKQVSEVVSHDVVCASANNSILDLTKMMAQQRASCIVIVEDRQSADSDTQEKSLLIDKLAQIPLGIVTEGDIVQFCNLRLDLANTKAFTAMSSPVLKIKASDSMWTANQVMQKHQVRRLVVTDDKNYLVGIITQTKVLEELNYVELLQTVDTLQNIVDEQTLELQQLNQQLQREVKERQLYQMKLQSSEAQLRALFEVMSDIILVVSISDSKIGTVQILPTYSGYEEQLKIDLASQTAEGFYQQQTAPLWLEKVTTALHMQQVVNFDYSLRHDNAEWWFSASISPIAENKILWVARDISKRKRLEFALQISETQERQKAQQLEIALNELKRAEVQLILNEKMASLGRMVGGIAHEINNPNNFIYGNIQPASEYAKELLHLIQLYQKHYPQPVSEISQKQAAIDLEYISQDFPKLLASIEEGAERISKIVKLLQAFSRLDSPKYKRIDIHQSLDSTIQFLQHRLQAQPNRPAIQVIKEYNVETSVECYPGQISQVFMSIIANAIDAIEERIEFSTITDTNNNQLALEISSGIQHPNFSTAPNSNVYPDSVDAINVNTCTYPYIRICTQVIDTNILITISNNGAAIKAENLPKIFEPFFTTKAPGKGTGLGLSICYKIISDAHSGQISCHSVEGQDTEFVITLPVVQGV